MTNATILFRLLVNILSKAVRSPNKSVVYVLLLVFFLSYTPGYRW